MKTDIPTELVEAQREYTAAWDEVLRLRGEYERAEERFNAAGKRHDKARHEFMQQVERQVQELAGSGEGT